MPKYELVRYEHNFDGSFDERTRTQLGTIVGDQGIAEKAIRGISADATRGYRYTVEVPAGSKHGQKCYRVVYSIN